MLTKTDKQVNDVYNINLNTSKLNGLIYNDNELVYQNVDMNLNLNKNETDSLWYTISEDTQYRPDKIAAVAYGDEQLYWVILKHNNLTDPFDLEIGLEIEIPSKQKVYDAINNKKSEIKYKAK